MNTLSVASILIGILINSIVILVLIWRFGSWSGRVTTLLEEHQRDLIQHDKRIMRIDREVAELRGHLERPAG